MRFSGKYSEVTDRVQQCIAPLFTFNDENANDGQLRLLSLFSGCGGMDIGFEGGFICHKKSVGANDAWIERTITGDWVLLNKNRFHTVFANDILPEANRTWVKYMSRFGVRPEVYHIESIVDLVKLHNKGHDIFPRDIDIVIGGFPCQDFSVAGKREGFDSTTSHDGSQIKDSDENQENRGRLYYWMKQVIDIVKPKVFVAENVKGLISLGEVKDIIQKDFASADGQDYIVLPPRVLDAGNYGVPETRERVIFIGIRRSALRAEIRDMFDKGEISDLLNPYPSPTHSHSVHSPELAKPVVCSDVLSELLEPDNSTDLSQRFYSKAKYMGAHCQGQTEIDIDGLGPTIRSEHHGNIEFRRLSKEHGGKMENELESGLSERRLTPRECALIQTFPPDYPFVCYKPFSTKFSVTASGAYKVIGNAVPPMLAYNIARRLDQLWDTYFD